MTSRAFSLALSPLSRPGSPWRRWCSSSAPNASPTGVLLIVSAVRRRGADRLWLLLLQGIVGIGAGVVTLLCPGITAIALFSS